MCAYGFAEGLTIFAFLRAVRRASRGLEEWRHEIQDDVPEAVAQDDAPKVPRLEDDESVEQSNREHEHEVDPVQEEDVKGCKDRGHVEDAAARAETVHRTFQQDRAEDEFLGQARREEDHDAAEDEGAERQLRIPTWGPQDEELDEAEGNARQSDCRLLDDLLPPVHGQTQISRPQSLHVSDRRDGNEEGHADEGEPRECVQRIRLRAWPW